MAGLVIDEHGRARPEGSQSLAARARAAGTFDDVPEGFLQSGSIYLRPLSQTLIVAFSPHLVGRSAVTAAFFEIARHKPGRVDLLCYGLSRSWRETLAPASHVFERIDQIVSDAASSAPKGLLSARLRLDVIDRVARSRLTPVFEAWEEFERSLDAGIVRADARRPAARPRCHRAQAASDLSADHRALGLQARSVRRRVDPSGAGARCRGAALSGARRLGRGGHAQPRSPTTSRASKRCRYRSARRGGTSAAGTTIACCCRGGPRRRRPRDDHQRPAPPELDMNPSPRWAEREQRCYAAVHPPSTL